MPKHKTHRTCCVADCKITSKSVETKFYTFPLMSYKLPQREKWIRAVRKVNNTPDWIPTKSDRLCSAHFIGNAKSDEQMSPSYAPTIFASTKMSTTKMASQTAAYNRHARFMKKRAEEILRKIQERKNKQQKSPVKVVDTPPAENYNTIYIKTEQNIESRTKPTIHQECQVETVIQSTELSKTFICNRYIYSSRGEAEIQTDIDIPGLAIKQEPITD